METKINNQVFVKVLHAIEDMRIYYSFFAPNIRAQDSNSVDACMHSIFDNVQMYIGNFILVKYEVEKKF